MSDGPRETSRRRAIPRDPRAEPESMPPPGEREAVAVDVVRGAPARGERKGATTGRRAAEPALEAKPEAPLPRPPAVPVFDPRAEPEPAQTPAADTARTSSPPSATAAQTSTPPAARSLRPSPSAAPAKPVGDPRNAEIESLLSRGDWKAIAARLGPIEKAAELPPSLALVYAVARKEAVVSEDANDARRENELAIRAVARLFDVGPESATALLIAKRILRKNPGAWSGRAAPPPRVSVLIVLLTIVLGAAIGYFISFGPSARILPAWLRPNTEQRPRGAAPPPTYGPAASPSSSSR